VRSRTSLEGDEAAAIEAGGEIIFIDERLKP
jgi:hypothetical protein